MRVLLELPALPGDDPPVLAHLAVFANPWPGAVAIWRSLDDGASYQQFAHRDGARRSSARRSTILPRGPTSRWDKVARARVKLYGGALASASDLRVLSGANAAAVQRPDGAWEILQFANAVLTAERTYELSRLLRGELGSEGAIADPLAGGRAVRACSIRTSCRSRAGSRRSAGACGCASSRRTAIMAIPARSRSSCAPGALAYQPLAPVHLRARREAGGVRFTWRARRRGLAGVSFAARPDLGEASEAYELEILSGRFGRAHARRATTPSALYAASDETLDFGGAQSSFSVRLYQMSAAVGRGLPATATLTP